jgi:protein-disulfide isomerase-like protein with CxxC motif
VVAKVLGKSTAILLAVAGGFLALSAIVIAMIVTGLDDRSTPVVVSIASTLGLGLTTLIGALKSAEAATSAKGAQRTAVQTASDTATIAQVVQAKCGDICPLLNCPLKSDDWIGT